MTVLGCWQFVVNLALPFFPVFLIQHLQYGITTAIGLGIVGQLAGTAAVPFWGKLSDQWSNKSVIALCAPLFLGCLFGWALAFQPAPQHLTLPIFVILQLVLGAATAGLDLASGNIALKLAPQGDATVFLGANGLVKSLCAGCAPIVGGVLIERMAHWSAPLSLLGDANKATKEAIWNLHPCQILFVIAGLLGVFALTRLASVKEMGDIGAGAVLRSLRRKVPASELQAVSDTAGRPL
jgi:MFS family permease